MKLVRMKGQPPNVTHYISGKVGAVRKEEEGGGVTWLCVEFFDKAGRPASSAWVGSLWVEAETSPEWEEAFAKWSILHG